ncbi:CorA metal ion transporter [Vermiconidia calcicola]|uniref:CorA metal ion transporter n=1 Tax=Vermiconidia calcicola TaxID=1690605 RepID=A0ACC3NYH9_9PEZI|nr:CorA metal ion transporter [Vermiconidia calcicola]
MASSRDDLAQVSGPSSMAKPTSGAEAQSVQTGSSEPTGQKKKKHRGGRRKKTKQQSFNATSEAAEDVAASDQRPSLLDVPNSSSQNAPFYRMNSGRGSNTSLESEALLDHREHIPTRPRRQSLVQSGFARPSLPFARHRGSNNQGASAVQTRSKLAQASGAAISEDEEDFNANDRTPLLSSSRNRSKPELSRNNSGHYGAAHRARKSSAHSKDSSRKRVDLPNHTHPSASEDGYDVNNPPSVPSSPKLGSLDDVLVNNLGTSGSDRGRDAVIDIDGDGRRFSEGSPEALRRRSTVADMAERDVCFPGDDLSEIGEEEDRRSMAGSETPQRRRTRARQWPDLSVLEEWSREEKEERTHQEHVRAKKISEPVLIGGRLRQGKTQWHREEDDAPFRFTYFNEMFDGTVHARTISDLLQEGNTFKDLFQPEPIELHDESSDEEGDENAIERPQMRPQSSMQALNGRLPEDFRSRQPSIMSEITEKQSELESKSQSRSGTPSGQDASTPRPNQKAKRYGPRPTFWLDVLQPTELEMKVIAKAFGIHQLTTEDILMEEQREKVELFHSYYFLNYRTFEQDKESPDYMDPVNFYVVVFRDGVITFHGSQTPHPANVRRRIRQLNDYMSPTADWISYAVIDDITDVYAPRVSQIEEDVDEIDEQILYMHVTSADSAEKSASENAKKPQNQGDMGAQKADGEKTAGPSGGDMLRRVGECRKNVMGLYRLLGNKADVIKGFAKRCNENWEVAPRSEIGLYLGDIQDHIVTMNNNLSHYENLLSRAHSNYVAQINIRMNERAEQNADILGKLTVIGTIVLPMNIITGMWGMNVWVPGQEYEGDLTWFWCITAGLLAFGLTCYFVAKKMYGIV